VKHLALLSAAVVTACVIASMPFDSGYADDEAVPIFGIKIFPGYRDWRLISVAHEEGDFNDLRAVSWQRCGDQGLPGRDGSVPGRHNYCAVGLEW
jgi:hypothetical protein